MLSKNISHIFQRCNKYWYILTDLARYPYQYCSEKCCTKLFVSKLDYFSGTSKCDSHFKPLCSMYYPK